MEKSFQACTSQTQEAGSTSRKRELSHGNTSDQNSNQSNRTVFHQPNELSYTLQAALLEQISHGDRSLSCTWRNFAAYTPLTVVDGAIWERGGLAPLSHRLSSFSAVSCIWLRLCGILCRFRLLFFPCLLNIGIQHTTCLTNGMPAEWMMVTLHRNISPLRAAMFSAVLGKTQWRLCSFLLLTFGWRLICVFLGLGVKSLFIYTCLSLVQLKSGVVLFASLLIQWNNACCPSMCRRFSSYWLIFMLFFLISIQQNMICGRLLITFYNQDKTPQARLVPWDSKKPIKYFLKSAQMWRQRQSWEIQTQGSHGEGRDIPKC